MGGNLEILRQETIEAQYPVESGMGYYDWVIPSELEGISEIFVSISIGFESVGYNLHGYESSKTSLFDVE